jgi:transcriptional regulator with XRE-family HTH domain
MAEPHQRFGQQIRNARKSAGLSRDTVAERADIKPGYFGEIERGEKWPSLDVIVRIAHGIGVSPAVFLEFEPPSDPKGIRDEISKSLQNRSPEQLQLALRILNAVFSKPSP